MIDPDFPYRRALTRGFRSGVPRNLYLSQTGDSVLFLRSENGQDPTNDLWRLSWGEGQPEEERLVRARDLLGDVPEDLPPAERARRERLRESSGGITAFSADKAHSRVVFTLAGRLWVHDLATGATVSLAHNEPSGATIDPTGRTVAYTSGGGLWVVDAKAGRTQEPRQLCAPGEPHESWGEPEFIAAEEMGRYRGFWWSPDGQSLLVTRVRESAVPEWWISNPAQPSVEPRPMRYPAAGTTNADVQLFLMNLTGEPLEVTWDRTEFEYLARVEWSQPVSPSITVQSRDQRRIQVLTLDPTDGTTRVVADRTEEPWIELIPGVPRLTPVGLLDVVVDAETDTRQLLLTTDTAPAGVAARPESRRADSTQSPSELPGDEYLTPSGLQIQAVVDADDLGVTFVARPQADTQDLFRVTYDGCVTRLSEPGGWAGGLTAQDTVAVSRADPHEPRTQVQVRRGTDHSKDTVLLRNLSEAPTPRPEPDWHCVGTETPNTAILWPRNSSSQSTALPIIMSPYGGPHANRAIRAASAFLTEQWLADQGFCVVVSDGPGTPRSPSYEARMAGDLAGPALEGQVAALQYVTETFADRVDPGAVGIRGWSFGGFLAALAVLERPDLFHAAVAGAPVTDWALYDTHYTERYLGTPQQHPDNYRTSDLLHRAPELSRPLLLIHGLADDNVFAAHTLQLSAELLAAGRPHQVLPLTGVTHMTPQEVVAENLLKLDLQFLMDALAPVHALAPEVDR